MLLIKRFELFLIHDTFKIISRINDYLLNTQESANSDFHANSNDEWITRNDENKLFDARSSLMKLNVSWYISIMTRLILINQHDQ